MTGTGLKGRLQQIWRPSLPVILQAEASECGLACLAMIAAHFGRATDLYTLRQRFPVSIQGMTLSQFIEIADRMGFNARPVRAELTELADLSTPCVLHWEMKHFVVLRQVTRAGASVLDPAVGRRSVDWNTLNTHFSGVALELSPGVHFEKKDERQRLRLADFWPYFVRIKGVLLQLLLLSLALQAMSLVSPFYMQLVVDEAIAGQDAGLLKALALGFLLLGLIQVAVSTLRSWMSLYLGNQLSFQFTSNLFLHLMRLPTDYFEKRHMGDIVSRFGAMGPVQDMLTSGLIGMLLDGLLGFTTLILIFVYSPLLAGIVLLGLALSLLIKLVVLTPSRLLTQESLVVDAREDSHFMETIRAIQTVKLSGNEISRHRQWQTHFVRSLNTQAKLGRLGISSGTVLSVLSTAEGILIVYLGAHLAIGGAFSVGMLYAFMSYSGQFHSAVTGLIDVFIELKMLGVHLERLADIVLTEEDAPRDEEVTPLPDWRIQGQISLQDIRFAYSPLSPPVLDGISLHIRAGESVALVGPSGCGKTTLLKLMVGLQRATGGQVSIDGVPLTPFLHESYWDQVGVVMQDDQLVSGTIADNVILKTGQRQEERLHSVCQLACVYEDIMSMPMGFNTLIGDMGSALSGGQKQRLLLARALYGEPQILFLDEATSHVDVALESRIAHHLKDMQITRVIVAHRPQSIEMCDRIIEVKQGRAVEMNTAHSA